MHTYNKTEGKYVGGEVDTGSSMGLRATPHWVAWSGSTDVRPRRNHRAHLKITKLDSFHLNGTVRLLIVHKYVVRFDIL